MAGVDNKLDSLVVDDIPASLSQINNDGFLSSKDSILEIKSEDYVIYDPEDITYFALNYSSVAKPIIFEAKQYYNSSTEYKK